MVSPARESEAPELNRGEFKERIPAYLVSSYQVHQPDLETVYSSNGTTTQVDPEVNHLGYSSYSPSNGAYPTNHNTYQQPGHYDDSNQVTTHGAAYGTGGEYKPLPPDQQEKQDKRRICGLALPTFIFFIVLGLVVIGASVGGALGVKASQNAKDAQDATASDSSATGAASSTLSNQPKATATTTSSSSSQTTDSSALSVPTTDVVVAFDCDARSGQNQTMEISGGHLYVYAVECGVDTISNGNTGIDLFAATTYTFEDCLRQYLQRGVF
ncbi:hypothetical protein PFICI_12119 [Pestalotiopsis fici W106-1]|uniref:Uncharacterized protein n=1 Tax=Pestalotiopsis fici (strain W106-1 / CGMCC3.15140) TaxID=1229662 RepID=W3WUE6_PESFW|nr:uncharacterized protein PFICI_12119 [Pestalotiopsis fici W106-1]ETS76732.1 hypothetical protein PFICI_12119 [Pestalotiopsis fici W106-1]